MLIQERLIVSYESPWKEPIPQDDFAQVIDQIAADYNFQQHPYLLWMQADTTTRSQFCRSQLGFREAVESFSQAIAAVMARVPRVEERLALVDNLAEEHGHGQLLRSHKYTFRQYLIALGASDSDLQSEIPIGVIAFNQSILNYCLTQPPECSAAMLGMIEYLYIGISQTISKTIHDRHWTVSGSQSHYAVHEVLDVEHARELFHLSEPLWQEVRSRQAIIQAMNLAAYYFWNLYLNLPSIGAFHGR
jgi:pyrroloquinoline-quinone synthase